jgi:phytol kinase
MIPPLLAILVVLVLLGGLMLGVRAAQQRLELHPEMSRKSVHVVMGLVCLTFPWLFRETWPVWTLAGMAVLGLGAIRLLPAFKSRFGHVLGGVERESWGELLFPLAVAFVFALSRGNMLLFCVPVLILSLADAMAALIGRRYGFARYETDDGWKSLEGSAAFFLVAFFTTEIALTLAADVGRTEGLLIATIMGLILMLMEAIAWRGLDNLFIPLVSYVCLVRMLRLEADALLMRLIVLAVSIVGLGLWRKSTRLTQSAVIGSALVLYVAWAVGGWHWLVAPVATAATYTVLCLRPARVPQRHTVHAIACIGGVGLCWLCLSQVIGTVNTIYAYGVGYGANLAMIALAGFAESRQDGSLVPAALKAMTLAFVVLAVPYLIVWRENASALPLAGWALVVVCVATIAFTLWQPSLRACPADAARWTRQGLISAVASVIAFVIISQLEPWSKSFR